MIILGIESSCDETAAAVLSNDSKRIQILSNIVSSSAKLQAKYGGIIPEQAAREQLKVIIPVIEQTIFESGLTIKDIDAIAVTYGPGLIGSLLVGVETAKTLSKIWNKPLIPVNHLLGHFYANWIDSPGPQFPYLGLLVSGGHSDLVLFKDHGKYEYLGGTRDDAAGECFDKCARLLGLAYPGGPEISKLASTGDPSKFKLPLPMTASHDLDFSFSGLKTAVANILKKPPTATMNKPDLCASIEDAIIKHLVNKVAKALQTQKVEHIIVAGGVAANRHLIEELKLILNEKNPTIALHVPPPNLCTDNGAMIAAAAFFQKPIKNTFSIQANPNLSLSK